MDSLPTTLRYAAKVGYKIVILAILLFWSFLLNAQSTIYSEPFTEADGTTSTSQFGVTCSSCDISHNDDYAEVVSNQFDFRDLDGEAVFSTSVINISGYTGISVTVDLEDDRDKMDASDYARVYYKLNGGSEILFTTNGDPGDKFGSVTASVSPADGSTLQIIIRVDNDKGDEIVHMDNITVTGTEVTAFDVSSTATEASCSANADGTIDLTVANGQAPYTYLWSNGETTEDVTDLAVGSYTVTVTDNNSDVVTHSKAVTTSSAGEVTVFSEDFTEADETTSNSQFDITCNTCDISDKDDYAHVESNQIECRDLDGEAVLTSSVIDIRDYTCLSISVDLEDDKDKMDNDDYARTYYKLDGGAETLFTTNGDPSGGFGIITASANPADGSTLQIIMRINNDKGDEKVFIDNLVVTGKSRPRAFDLSSAETNISCPADTDGEIDLTVTGGLAPYTYAWSNGATTQDITGLSAGTYTVTVTDDNGDSETHRDTISAASTLSLTGSSTDAIQGLNGSMCVAATGGTPPYTYNWSNGETTMMITGLTPDTYTVTVTDDNSCAATLDITLGNMYELQPFASGSKIINMGVTPQTFENGLKPYGLVYDLTRNHNIPVKWIIDPDKAKDGTDFTHNSVNYKGGPFIIEAGYLNSTINSVISSWESQGVVTATLAYNDTLPVYTTLNSFSNMVIDENNEGIVTPYFSNAGIPSSIYTVGLPGDLSSCHDVYVLPHADPTWNEHGVLRDFNRDQAGYIWSGCHAVSMLEGIFDPSNSSNRMNFLSINGLQCYSGGKCEAHVSEDHDSPNGPYTYDSGESNDPVMQFMGDMVPATEGGSEQIYIPLSTGGWNPGTSVAVSSSDGSGNKVGAKLVYGFGYDNPMNGRVIYEAGHAMTNGDEEENVAAQRVFFNFILLASKEKGIKLNSTSNVPSAYAVNVATPVSVSPQGGTPPYTYQWTVSSDGTFGDATAASTTLTLTSVYDKTITCLVTDACGRTAFVARHTGSAPPSSGSCQTAGDGNWSNPATWSGCTGPGGIPGANDTVAIMGRNITVDMNASIGQLHMDGYSTLTSLTFTGSNSLNVTYDVLLHSASSSASDINVNMNGTGSLVIGDDLILRNDNDNDGIDITITAASSSAITIGGDIELPVKADDNVLMQFEGSSTLNLAGNVVQNSQSSKKFGSLNFIESSTLNLNGSAQQSIPATIGSGNDGMTYNNMIVDNSYGLPSQVSITGDITINGTLTLTTGILSTAGNTITIETAGASAISGGDKRSYIMGTVCRRIGTDNHDYMFPVGKGGAQDGYHWVTVSNNYLVGVNYLCVSFEDWRPNDRTQFKKYTDDYGRDFTKLAPEGFWLVEPDQQPIGGSYTIEASTENLTLENDLNFGLIKRSSGGGPEAWVKNQGSRPSFNEIGSRISDKKTKLMGLTSFSEFGAGEGDGGALPIELTHFDAQAASAVVDIDWRAATEINNDYFTIERSLDGIEFEEVLIVDGAGNSTEVTDYTAQDPNPYSGTSYYRLRQTDYDGSFAFSEAVAVTVVNSGSADEAITIYPNPNSGNFHIKLTEPVENIKVSVFSTSGQLIYYSESHEETNLVNIRLSEVENFTFGIYVVQVSAGENTYLNKIITQ